jgi:recombination DNA repair RAD52 pathway protein
LKKLLFTTLAIIMAFTLSIPSAFADVKSEEDKNMQLVQEKVDNVNEKIADLIDTAVEEGEELYEAYQNSDLSVEEYTSERDAIIDELQEETESISVKTKEYAANKGIEVKIYFIDVTIGDRTVPVDPLRVIGKLDR